MKIGDDGQIGCFVGRGKDLLINGGRVERKRGLRE